MLLFHKVNLQSANFFFKLLLIVFLYTGFISCNGNDKDSDKTVSNKKNSQDSAAKQLHDSAAKKLTAADQEANELYIKRDEFNDLYKEANFNKFIFQAYSVNPADPEEPFRLVCYTADKDNKYLKGPLYLISDNSWKTQPLEETVIFGNIEFGKKKIQDYFKIKDGEEFPAFTKIILTPFIDKSYLNYKVTVKGGTEDYGTINLNPCPPAVPDKINPAMLNAKPKNTGEKKQ
jgi:hypothetical protein